MRKNEVLYAGYRLDAETGLYNVRNREYHPTLGRWTSQDPAGYIDGLNLYQYCGGRPADATDPTGLVDWEKVERDIWGTMQGYIEFTASIRKGRYGNYGTTIMEAKDIHLLQEMREAISAYRTSALGVGPLADQLLALRDGLQFKDQLWSHELTQQVATLDSASTFTPMDDEQTRRLSHAIADATGAILKLIEDKLV